MTRLGLGAQHRLCALYDGNMLETKSFAGKQRVCFVLRLRAEHSGGTAFTLHSDVKRSLCEPLSSLFICRAGRMLMLMRASKFSPFPRPQEQNLWCHPIYIAK